MSEVVAGFFLGFIVALCVVGATSTSSKCSQSKFYMEPKNAQPVPRMAPSERTEKVSGKGLSRVLETSLVGGPWESQ